MSKAIPANNSATEVLVRCSHDMNLNLQTNLGWLWILYDLSLTAAETTKSKLPPELDVVATGRQRTVSASGAVMEEVSTQTTLKRPAKINSTECNDLSVASTSVSNHPTWSIAYTLRLQVKVKVKVDLYSALLRTHL